MNEGLFKYFENKKILITGASGLIGSNLIKTLISNTNNTYIIATGRDILKLIRTFPEYKFDNRLELLAFDVNKAWEFEKIRKEIDFIFHAAGPQESKIIENNPIEVIQANIDGLRNCLNFLRLQNLNTFKKGRLIVFSSLTIYGSNFGNEIINLTEDDTHLAGSLNQKSSVYSESKRMSEILANAYHKEHGIDFIICRLSTIYGACKNPTRTAFFEFLNKAKKGLDINVREKFGPKRDNLYIKDAINGILYAASKGENTNAYNISSGGKLNNFLSVGEIAMIIAEVANKKLHKKNLVNVKFTNENFFRSRGFILNNGKLNSLGWKVCFEYKEAIKEIIF